MLLYVLLYDMLLHKNTNFSANSKSECKLVYLASNLENLIFAKLRRNLQRVGKYIFTTIDIALKTTLKGLS